MSTAHNLYSQVKKEYDLKKYIDFNEICISQPWKYYRGTVKYFLVI